MEVVLGRRRIWKNKEGKKIPTIPQKLNWKRNSSYDTFDEADKVRTELKKDPNGNIWNDVSLN